MGKVYKYIPFRPSYQSPQSRRDSDWTAEQLASGEVEAVTSNPGFDGRKETSDG